VVCICACQSKGADKLSDRVNELIRQLGSDNFQQREQASKDLISLGEPALTALRLAAKGTDADVARRATACITQIERNLRIVVLIRTLQQERDPTTKVKAIIELGN